MKIEQAYDKVVLTNQEVQEALRKLVEEKTKRNVRGHVVVSMQQSRLGNSVLQYSPITEGAAFCYLEVSK